MLGTVPFVSSRHSQMIYFLAVASVLAQKGAVLELTGDAPTIHFGELGGADVLTLVHNSTEDELVCSGKIRASDVVIESTSTTVADLIGEVATLRQDMAAVKQIGARDLQKPWAASTVVLGKYGSIGTQGSYRTSLTWNYGRDRHATPSPTYSTLGITRWDDGHTFTQAGAVEIGSSGLLFRYQNAFGTNESDGPLNRMTLNEDSLSLAAGIDLAIKGSTFFSDSIQTGQQTYSHKPWAASTVVLGKYGSIGTQGSYRTSLTWNYGRDRHATPSPTYSTLGITRWDDGHTFTQAGAVEIGSSGLLFRYQNAFGTNESDGPLNRMTLNEDSLSLAAGTQLGVGAASPDEGLHLYRSGSTHTRR